MKRLLILLPFVLILVSCSGNPGQLVTKEEYGGKWAFTVEKGYVCSIDQAAIFKAGGVEYQLNGAATMKGYKSIDPIWRNNPDLPGTKINIGPFINLALKNPK